MTTRLRRSGLVIAIVGLQFAIPTVALVAPGKPTRLGWQMYSGLGDDPVEVSDVQGSPIDVPWSGILAKPRRPELDWTNHLPEHLCTFIDEPLITVTVGAKTRTVEC